MSLVTVGTVAFDSIETPFGKADRVVGGAATYISLAASYFTEDLNLVSVVGDDFPNAELEYLQSRDVNIDGLANQRGRKILLLGGTLPR